MKKRIKTSGGHARYPDPGINEAPGGRAVASWMVSNAKGYGLREVQFAGRHWKSSAGHDGWTHDGSAPADQVIVR